MGVEAFPQKKLHSCHQKTQSRTYLGISQEPPERVAKFEEDKEVENKLLEFHQSKDYVGFHEMLQQNVVREQPPQKGRQDKSKREKKMALVHHKFMEAKRLVTDEKLRHTKEFRDALEVLTSNRELFLSFLQEANSLLSGNLGELQSMPRETKRITILRPSKMIDQLLQNDEWMMKRPVVAEPSRLCDCADKDSKVCSPQPGRIVELMPSSRKIVETKTSSSPCYQDDVTGEITSKVEENLGSCPRDETLLSSVYSNDYKSEGEAIANLSDSEVMSPPSGHSWDFINKVESPYSLSSFSHVSYSPESSVRREAKRRLSERWALMTSHGTSYEHRHVRKDSITLGEILALLDTNNKRSVRDEESASGEEQQLIGSLSQSISDSNKEEYPFDLQKCLMRSKSLPSSSSIYSDNLNVESVDPLKEAANKGNVNPSSFKGKVSSLFSLISRKSKEETPGKPRHEDKIQSSVIDPLGDLMKDCQVGLSGSKLDSKDNQDHPNPISVLDPSIDEYDSLTSESSGDQGTILPLGCNFIDKSPSIGSISRTLPWDDGIDKATTLYFSNSPTVSPVMEEAFDWLTFVQTLVSEAGFDGQLSLHSFVSRWYSSDSPLDPSLRERFAKVKDKGTTMPETKRRQKMSERKLAYDCVNIALAKVGGLLEAPYDNTRDGNVPATLSDVGDRVWAQMKQCFSDEVRCVSKYDGDSNRLMVEKVVRKEVVGKSWVDHLATEMDCVGKNIELKLLDEMVDEAVTDLTGRL